MPRTRSGRRPSAVTVVSLMMLFVPTAASAHVVVAEGDTLSGLAGRHGVSTSHLAAVNGIADPDRIRAGSRLAVTGDAAETTSTSPTSRPADSTVEWLITDAAQARGWRSAVPLGLAMQESGWNQNVVSGVGAIGLMQVLPATGEWVGTYLLGRGLDLHDPADNVAAGMAYLDYLYNRFDRDLDLTLAAYYEGPQRVTDNGPSVGGQRYAANVRALADRYR